MFHVSQVGNGRLVTMRTGTTLARVCIKVHVLSLCHGVCIDCRLLRVVRYRCFVLFDFDENPREYTGFVSNYCDISSLLSPCHVY